MDTAYRVSPLLDADPEHLGGYTLAGRLGAGGMGVVYLGRSPQGEHVAVKTVHAVLAGQAEFRKRFRSELEQIKQVPPYCTAELLDADLDNDPPYLVVEYVDGPSLAEVVERGGPLRSAQLRPLAAGIATALVGIHGAGVVHRDLKPENVLLPPGNPKVIDFGIARAFDTATGLTAPDQTIGTIGYMAPERLDPAASTPAGSAADVFAWGCVTAYAAAGHSPFRGDTPAATAARILTQPPDLTGLEEPLLGAVEAALAKEPERRPSARELLDMLIDGTGNETGPARPPPRRRRRWVMAAAAAAVLLGGTAATVVAVGSRNGDPVPVPVPVPAPVRDQPLIQDALRAPSAWHDTGSAQKNAQCTVQNELTVRRVDRKPYMCSGSEVIVKSAFSAKFATVIKSRKACAALWFYWNPGRGGDVVRICQDDISLGVDDADGIRVIGAFPAAQRLQVSWKAHIRIEVAGGFVTVFRGGDQVGRLALPAGTVTTGKIRLGIDVPQQGGMSPFEVAFSGLEVRALGS